MFDRSLFKHFARRKAPTISHSPPVVPLPVQGERAPLLLVFDHRDLAIEMAYECRPQHADTRVRSTSRDTQLYFTPPLTPVFAVNAGLIVYARKHTDGFTIIIDHCNSWLSVYHRLEHIFVTPSERRPGGGILVHAGDVLGYLADSRPGPYNGPLLPLRFELYRRERDDYDPVDPLRFIRRWQQLCWSGSPTELRQTPAEPDDRSEGGDTAAGDRPGDPIPLETPRPA